MNVLEQYKNLVWPSYKDYLEKNLPDNFHRQITMDYPLRQGKYLRPALLLMTAGALGVDINSVIPTATAMQMSEDWILNHDDIEDDSEQRRGDTALHKKIGIPLAVNAGDALHALNWQLIHSLQNEKLFTEFSKILNQTIAGQTYEIKFIEDKNFDLSYEQVYKIIETKTCYYTISGPMRLGAIFANCSDEQLQSIYNFGLSLGKAFQIIDDYLDLTSDFEGQKKQIGNDIYEGKRTVFLVHLLEHDKDPKILEILKKDRSHKTPSDVNYIINTMKKNKSLEYGHQLAADFTATARHLFDTDLLFLNREPYRQQLALTIDFIVDRKK
jgi:geranylgeranyl diphosphate synthase type II